MAKNKGQSTEKKRRGGSYKPGQSGNPAGRPPGVMNKAGQDGRAVCRLLVEDPIYRAGFAIRLNAGTLGSGLEAMVWHYAYGKPQESLDVTLQDGPRLDLLSDDEREAVDAAMAVIHLARLKATGHDEVRH